MLDKTTTLFSHIKPGNTPWRSEGLRGSGTCWVEGVAKEGFVPVLNKNRPISGSGSMVLN